MEVNEFLDACASLASGILAADFIFVTRPINAKTCIKHKVRVHKNVVQIGLSKE